MIKVLVYAKDAVKGLRKIPKADAKKVTDAFNKIAQGDERGLDIRKLKGRDALRLRVGNYRAIYSFDLVIMSVEAIGHRKDIYQ